MRKVDSTFNNKFEFVGYVCRHMFLIYQHEGVSMVTDKYILNRWKRDVKKKVIYAKTEFSTDMSEDAKIAIRGNNLYTAFLKLYGYAMLNDTCYNMGLKGFENLATDVCKTSKDLDGCNVTDTIKSKTMTNNSSGRPVLNVEIEDTVTYPLVKGFKRRQKEKGQHRLKSCLEKRTRRKNSTKDAKKRLHIDDFVGSQEPIVVTTQR